MDGLEIIILSEANQTEKDIYITYMWNLKNDTKEHVYKNKNRLTYIENRLWFPKGKSGVGVTEREIGSLRLMYIQYYI